MRPWITALCLLACPVAGAETAVVLKDWSQADMRGVLHDLGAAPSREGGAGENPYFAIAGFDFPFEVRSAVCASVSGVIRCQGAEFSTVIAFGDADVAGRAARALSVAPVALTVTQEGGLRIARYIIFDSGITRDNLRSNAEVFISATRRAYRSLQDQGFF